MTKLDVCTTIDPDDQMWESGRDWYFQVGQSGLDVVRKIVSLSWKQEVTSILDLPCGHGRVGRFLRAAYPNARMTFADLDSKGADFCAREFGGRALHSQPDLDKVVFDEQYDVIWVGSLFTHVDHTRTGRWLRHLCDALSPNGVLVATFHGRWSIEVQEKYHQMIDPESWSRIIQGYNASGYGYAPYPHMREEYGVSLSRASKIVATIEDVPGIRMLAYIERGWADNHDVLGVAKTDRLLAWPLPK